MLANRRTVLSGLFVFYLVENILDLVDKYLLDGALCGSGWSGHPTPLLTISGLLYKLLVIAFRQNMGNLVEV